MDTNPQAFASTANLEYGESHAKGFVLKAESEEIRSRHVEIIRQLLQDFDLDKTKERYQSAHVYKFNVEQTDCSADSSMARSKVKRRLEYLMGSNVVYLNDKKYMQTLTDRLQEEYEKEIRAKELELAKGEDKRLRKLMLDGIIPMTDNPHAQGDHRNSKSSKKTRKRSRSRDKNYRESEFSFREPTEIPSQVQMSRSPTHRRSIDTRSQHSSSPKSTRSASKDETMEQEQSEREDSNIIQEAEDDYRSQKEKNSHERSKYERYESPEVQELRQEETVDGLYRIADELIL